MEVQAVTVPLVLLRAAVRVLGVPAPALAVRALEVLVLDTLALEVLHVAAQKVPVQGLHVAVPVLGVLAPVQVAPTPGALTPVVTLEIPARVDIQDPTLAAPVHRGTPVTPVHKDTRVTQILGATQGLVLVAPAHAAIPILTQATQDLRVTRTTTPVTPTRKVIQTRAQVALITTTATATITITTITMTTTTTTTITTAMTTARD